MSRQYLDKRKLLGLLPKFRKVKALVVGDIILDHYIWGEAERLSPEAPVPVVWAKKEDYLLGGASNVAHNIRKLGGKVELCGVVGRDFYARRVKNLLKENDVSSELVLTDKDRFTSLKTRVVAQSQQVVRVDWESCEFLSWKINKKIVSLIRKNIQKFDLVIIEDYGKGVINPQLLEEIVHLCKKEGKIITVDPKEEHFDYYQDVTALTPNLKEAQTATGIKVRTARDLEIVGEVLLERLNPQALLITLGEEGMRLFINKEGVYHLPTYALEVFDVSGAGDTVIAVFSLARASGASFKEAAILANLAAGIVVGKFGIVPVLPEEIEEKIEEVFQGRGRVKEIRPQRVNLKAKRV